VNENEEKGEKKLERKERWGGGRKQTDRKIEIGRERDRKEERARERVSLAIKRDGENEIERGREREWLTNCE